MNAKESEKFRVKLIAEKTQLEEELLRVSRRDSEAEGGWQATSGEMEVDAADENEIADKMEELEENSGIAARLETQLTEVGTALDRIGNGKFGLCEKCGKPIKPERLEANPSARNCMEHAH